MNMKTLKFLLMALVVMIAANAKAGNVQYLVLDLANGTQTVVALDDQPVITCKGGELKVTVGSEVKVSASLDDVAKYSFSENEIPSSLQPILSEESRIEEGHFYVANAKKGDVVCVYSVSGRLVASQRVDDNGIADVDLTTLGKGLFIVKSAKTAIKIMNK